MIIKKCIFLNYDHDSFIQILNNVLNKFDIDAHFVITHPYWVYSIDKKNNKLLLDIELNKKVEKLICKSFYYTKKINRISISQVSERLKLRDLTFDKRHLKSSKIKLKNYKEICNF